MAAYCTPQSYVRLSQIGFLQAWVDFRHSKYKSAYSVTCLFVCELRLSFVETQPCSCQTGAFLFWSENQFCIYNVKLSSPYFRQKILFRRCQRAILCNICTATKSNVINQSPNEKLLQPLLLNFGSF